jgi:predicted lipopolysaccharide heptosyltransferase III
VKILLIRLRLIGDVVFTTPAIAALRRHFPDARITYLVEAPAAPVVRGNPHLDNVIVAERPRGVARIVYDLRLARRLRNARYDVVIDFHGGPRSSWLTFATGAQVRVGYARPGRSWAYTRRLPWSRALVPPRHSVQKQWDLLIPLGVAPDEAARTPVEMVRDDAVADRVRARLAQAGVRREHAVIVIHVSAGNPFRRWPADSFARLAATLADEEAQRRIIITSGPSEREAADAVATAAQRLCGAGENRIVRCGEFDLAELRALVADAALYIGGDSGPLHVAATSEVPVVALFGPTLPERSMPWRSPQRAVAVDAGPLPCRPCHQRECAPGDFRCLTRIAPERVLAAARQLLKDREC